MIQNLKQKIQDTIRAGFKSETEIVYLMVNIRKIIELDNSYEKFQYLNFYCNWILHSKLNHKFAQEVIKKFESIYIKRCSGQKIERYPFELRQISRMDKLVEQFSNFCQSYALDDFTEDINTLTKFLYLYVQALTGTPLRIKIDNATYLLQEVSLQTELAIEPQEGHQFYKISWILKDKNGNIGEISIHNSFEVESITD